MQKNNVIKLDDEQLKTRTIKWIDGRLNYIAKNCTKEEQEDEDIETAFESLKYAKQCIEKVNKIKKKNSMEELLKEYIIKDLELQETKLKCINLGFCKSEQTKIELKMIEKAKELVNNKL